MIDLTLAGKHNAADFPQRATSAYGRKIIGKRTYPNFSFGGRNSSCH